MKFAIPPEKSHPLIPSNPFLKLRPCPALTPLFWKIWLEIQAPLPHPSRKGGWGGAHYGLAKLLRSLQTGACNIKQI